MREDWIEVELGEVFETVTGNTPSKRDPENYGSEIPFVKPPEVINRPISKGEESLSIKGVKRSRLLSSGSVLVTCIGNLGRTGIAKRDVAFNQQINAIKPLIGIDSYFTFYQAQSPKFKNQLEKLSSATTVPIVNKGKFNTIQFRIAPLPEQRAIVARIEELFSELDHSIANLKSAQAKLEIYRQAVLKKAFEGGFTDQNLKWKDVEFGQLIKSIDAGKSFRCDERPPKKNEVGVLKVSAVTWGEFLEEESKTVTDNSKINKSYFVNKGDFLLSRANTIELVGNSVIVKSISKTLMLSDKTLRLKFHEDLANDFYFLYFLSSRDGKKQIQILSSGNQESMRNIGQSRIKQILIPIPPKFEIQTLIVQEIESRLSVADKLAETIKTNLLKSESLRQSILKQAFEGKLLTEAALEACRKEADWEPAEKLLQRIKKEKKS